MARELIPRNEHHQFCDEENIHDEATRICKDFFEKYPQYDANDLFIILVRVALYESAMANLNDIEEKLK